MPLHLLFCDVPVDGSSGSGPGLTFKVSLISTILYAVKSRTEKKIQVMSRPTLGCWGSLIAPSRTLFAIRSQKRQYPGFEQRGIHYDNQLSRHTFLHWRSPAALAAIQDVLTGQLAISQAEMSTILRTGRHKWDSVDMGQERSSRIGPPGYVSPIRRG